MFKNRDVVIPPIRVTSDERKLIAKAAENLGMGMSLFMRKSAAAYISLLFDDGKPTEGDLALTEKDHDALSQLRSGRGVGKMFPGVDQI